jgi:hypothetical protein
MSIILLFLVLLNFVISWFNAWSVGRGWAETKVAGGFARFMSWCGAIMSASGFTWCYLVIICVVGQLIPGRYHLPDKYAEGVFRLGYLIIILPILGSGLAITIQSWMYFWKERNWKSGAVAGWNTLADIYNIYQAASAIPESLSFLGNLFSNEDDDEDNSFWVRLVIALAILCVIGGIVTTTTIVLTTARKTAKAELKRA